MSWIIKITLFIFLAVTSAQAQPFTIEDAGEYDLATRTIKSSGVLSEYFAMNLKGSGIPVVRVSIGNQSTTKTFRNLNSPRITSFLFSYDLAREVDISFRKGVVGTILIELIDENGNVNASSSIRVNKNYGERGCSRNKSKKLKTCQRVNLRNATSSQRSKLVQAFAKSLRGPIVLEP